MEHTNLSDTYITKDGDIIDFKEIMKKVFPNGIDTSKKIDIKDIYFDEEV